VYFWATARSQHPLPRPQLCGSRLHNKQYIQPLSKACSANHRSTPLPPALASGALSPAGRLKRRMQLAAGMYLLKNAWEGPQRLPALAPTPATHPLPPAAPARLGQKLGALQVRRGYYSPPAWAHRQSLFRAPPRRHCRRLCQSERALGARPRHQASLQSRPALLCHACP
jgi:hypothetical protein